MSASLQFYWYEIKPSEEPGKRWGELAGAMHRLLFVCGELESTLNANDINEMLHRLQYHAENYLIRIYELRERAVVFIAGLCGDENLAGPLKSKKKRVKVIAQIKEKSPSLVEPLERLLATLEDDVELRSFHTHKTFLSIGLWIDNDVYDPWDALRDVENKPDERMNLECLLREEAERLVTEYAKKGGEVVESTMCLLNASDRR